MGWMVWHHCSAHQQCFLAGGGIEVKTCIKHSFPFAFKVREVTRAAILILQSPDYVHLDHIVFLARAKRRASETFDCIPVGSRAPHVHLPSKHILYFETLFSTVTCYLYLQKNCKMQGCYLHSQAVW